jgi:hypothetical protein
LRPDSGHWSALKAENSTRSLAASVLEIASITLVMIAFLVLLGVVFNLGPVVVAEGARLASDPMTGAAEPRQPTPTWSFP